MWNRLLSKIFGGKFEFDFSCVTGNGYITVEVLKEILREIDTSLDEYSLEQIIDEVDEDGSGTVDFDEFMAMMTGEWFFTNKSHFFNKKNPIISFFSSFFFDQAVPYYSQCHLHVHR